MHKFISLVTAFLLAFSLSARAIDVQKLWITAHSKFATGDCVGASKDLEAIIANTTVPLFLMDSTKPIVASPNQQWLEPVFYMLGASYFNAKDWKNAISTFKRYGELFPKSKRLGQILFSQAQALYYSEAYADSEQLFIQISRLPFFHEKSILFLVNIYKKTDQPLKSISLLEAELAATPQITEFAETIKLILAHLYLDQNQTDKAVTLLFDLDSHIDFVTDVTQFNALAVQIGDLFLKSNKLNNSLDAYRRVRDNDQIVELQSQHMLNLQRQRKSNVAAMTADPLNTEYLQIDNEEIDVEIAKNEKILAAYKTLPPILPKIFLKLANAYAVSGQLWESAVVFRRVLQEYPDTDESETALYGSLVVYDKLKRTERASLVCNQYLTEYPKGKYINSVSFLQGVLAYDAQDFDKASALFQAAITSQPNNPEREQMELILGDILLQQQKFDDAVVAYKKYLTDYPSGTYIEKAEYRTDLARLFGNKPDEAVAGINDYISKHPSGMYVADAEYRLAVLDFSSKQYDKAIADCVAWQAKHPSDGPRAQVLSLLGDCHATLGNQDQAVDDYTKASKIAPDNNVLNYSLFGAAKILEKQKKWNEVIKLCDDFIQNNPDNSLVVSAIAWIARGKVKLGQADEARDYMVSSVKKYLNEPQREAVEEILSQLARLSVTKHVAPDDVVKLLTPTDLKDQEPTMARMLFIRQEMAVLKKDAPTAAAVLQQISKNEPEDLSPLLLGVVGDYFRAKGDTDNAKKYYQYLLDQYPKSQFVDYAYNGLGDISYTNNDYNASLKYYTTALDCGLAAGKLKDLTLGMGKTLLAMNNLDDAKKYFEQVASTREWRGECTAFSVYSLGQIEMLKGKYAEANAYFQRVYVGYQKYPSVQAKAYLASGKAFEKLGMPQEARNTYQEMLKNTSLTSCPEFSEVLTRFTSLPVQ